MDMATLSEESVNAALESYEKGVMLRPQIFEYSEKLRILQLEVADFATELIARYQPVARDLDSSSLAWMSHTAFQDLVGMHMIFQMY
jgi:phosphate uptake regulator